MSVLRTANPRVLFLHRIGRAFLNDFFFPMMHAILIGLCNVGSSTLAHDAFATQRTVQ